MIIASVSGYEKEIEQFGQFLTPREVGRMVNREIVPVVEMRMDRVIREVPPARGNEKFVWSYNRAANARARRWWFMAIKKGLVTTDGRHYVRTDEIPNAWQLDLAINVDEILLRIFNPAEGSEHVYGSDQQTQVPGHATTGWRNYQYFLSFIEALNPEIVDAWVNLVDKSIKRTRRR